MEDGDIGENFVTRSFIVCSFRQMLLGLWNQGGWDGRGI